MDVSSFFGTPRWKILEALADRPSAPSELSVLLSTSVAYVSQQLKLLEAAGLVIKQKTGVADKGKPRSLYSLSSELLYLTVLANGWSIKKMISLSNHHKIILRIWSIGDSSAHIPLERTYWALEPYLSELIGLYYSPRGKGELQIISDSKSLKSRIDSIINERIMPLSFSLLSRDEFLKKSNGSIFPLYDPHTLLQLKETQMKGGLKI